MASLAISESESVCDSIDTFFASVIVRSAPLHQLLKQGLIHRAGHRLAINHEEGGAFQTEPIGQFPIAVDRLGGEVDSGHGGISPWTVTPSIRHPARIGHAVLR